MKFLGNVLATIVGILVFILFSFFGLALIATVLGGGSNGLEVEENSVLELQLGNVTSDYAGKYKDPWMNVLSESQSTGLSDVILAIEAAKSDQDIKGISILNNSSAIGMAQTKALRDALEDFKKSGKFVLSYSNSYSQKDYYLNSVAQAIYIHPEGDFSFKGLSAEIQFFKDLQDKSGVKMEVIRHGKYKAAVEPFLDNKMSEANKEQTLAMLQSIWDSTLADISKSRKISVEKLNEIANGLLARTPQAAKTQKLVDQILFEDQYHDIIKKRLGVSKDEDYKKVSIEEYTQIVTTTANSNLASDQIALIYAQGQILGGEGDVETIGEGSINRSLSEARKNENIKAIVLRIDSPGGSALTSELIWREIELTKKVKPVVASMGNYAASGGYYIACNSNKIFAENNTITGSIGVFGVLPNFTGLARKIGIHTEQIKTNANASEYSPFIPIDENFKAVTQESVERVYNTFVSHVANGRKMKIAQIDSIAQGRVWTGAQAVKIGLVDKIGGLDEAIKEAAKLSKTISYSIQTFPEYNKELADIIKLNPFSKSRTAYIKEELGEETWALFDKITKIQKLRGVQAIMPFELKIN